MLFPSRKIETHLKFRRLSPILLCSIILAAGCAPSLPPPDAVAQQSGAAASALIPLTAPDGERLLYSSETKRDFLPLSIHFVSQQNLAYCGAASMTMVLNALGIPAPVDPAYVRFPMFTQNNVFNPGTERVLPVKTVATQGMTLDQLGGMLATYPLDTRVYHTRDSSLDEFRKLAAENLQQSGNFILVNYLRKTLGQQTGGHISPLAAYDHASDRFLILDVARFKYPPVWVKAETLWQAMDTVDDASGKTRGFIMIGRAASSP